MGYFFISHLVQMNPKHAKKEYDVVCMCEIKVTYIVLAFYRYEL